MVVLGYLLSDKGSGVKKDRKNADRREETQWSLVLAFFSDP
jgi:hypothetical protein